jgi:glycosyltransferase involved in cell wall biosynthesis
MDRNVTVLVPDVHDRPTGGNVYNRRIAEEGGPRATVEVVPWRPGEEDPSSLNHSPGAALVVDSLLTRHEAPLRALRAAHPRATLVLLAHYLHCIDPNERDAPAAATERAVLPLFDGVVTTSSYAKQALVEEGISANRVEVVPPGLGEAYRAPMPDRPARDTPRLLTVAGLQPGKGLPSLVDALGRLPDTAWTWALVGDDTLDPEFAEGLRNRIWASGIGDRVEQIGPIPPAEMRAQYDRADVFVLPSRFETCSMATREALARGLPVVATDVGGLSDNFSEAATPSAAPSGRLVPLGCPDLLADALRVLLTDPVLRREMGTAARERSRAFPTWGEAAERFRGAVLSLLSPPEDL